MCKEAKFDQIDHKIIRTIWIKVSYISVQNGSDAMNTNFINFISKHYPRLDSNILVENKIE